MFTRVCFFFILLCSLCCKGQDRRTKEQRERGDPEPIVWNDPTAKSILDSVAAPKLATDTIQFRRDLVKFLSFVNNEPRTDSISFYTAHAEIDKKGAVHIQRMSGSRDLESQLFKRMQPIADLLNFTPAHILKAPERKSSFYLDVYIYMEKDVVRFSIIGVGNVKYLEAYFSRPLN